MTPQRWKRLIEIVDEALKRPDEDERRRFLKEACDGDRRLRQEVEDLLRQEPSPRNPEPGTACGGPSPPSPLSQTFGPFRIREILGRGGMGVVGLTTDELGRPVALKILRREKVSDDLLRRFDAERRLHARLEHPAIARIYDGGDVDGVPYFTMEYVDGEPIDVHCDHRRLDVDARLRLVLPRLQAPRSGI